MEGQIITVEICGEPRYLTRAEAEALALDLHAAIYEALEGAGR